MPDGSLRPGSARSVADEALAGLLATRKTLQPKLFYDEEGCRLFGEITRLPEYYPTRTEMALLRGIAPELLAGLDPGAALVEYGASDETKARLLLDRPGAFAAYVPIDVAATALDELAARLAGTHPDLTVHPLVADFTAPLGLPDAVSGLRRLGFFPGSTIGNLCPEEARQFLRRVRGSLGPAASFVVGVDLRKDPAVLEAAYDDAQGVTAAFNLNLLRRLNREAESDFDLATFGHRAVWNEAESRIEMHLVSRVDQQVQVAGTPIAFAAGEAIHSESSYKYTEAGFAELAAGAGWHPARCWTDPARLFSIHLLAADQAAPSEAQP